nr:amidohydrolase [Allomuricauda sp.]
MSENLKIALVQTELAWEDPVANRALFEDKLKALEDHVDVVIFPEMFTTGFTMTPNHIQIEEGEKTVDWMVDLAKERGIAIVGSIVFTEQENHFNRLVFALPDGEVRTYDKKHTFTLAGEDKVYKAGDERIIVDYKGFKICPLICYDLRFPIWARNTVNYDVLLYVANWPKPRIDAWDALLKARAIENMAYCIGVNRVGKDASGHEYSGHSAVYDVLGNRLAYSEQEEILGMDLHKEHIRTFRNKLKFLDDRDEFSLK